MLMATWGKPPFFKYLRGQIHDESTVPARGVPPIEQGFTSDTPRLNPLDPGEEEIAQDFRKDCRYAPDRVIPHPTASQCEIPARSVHPELIETAVLMNKVAIEVSQGNLKAALEILEEAIKLHPADGYLFLLRTLMNHLLGQEGVERDLQAAERLRSTFEIAEGTGEHFTPSVAYSVISHIVGVPTYREEKLCGKEVILKEKIAVTKKQKLNVEVRLIPSNMLRHQRTFIHLLPDGNVEVTVTVDYLRFKVVRSETTSQLTYPDHFLQSLKVVVRPTGKWSKSFSEGFGLTKCSPGNELNPLSVQQDTTSGCAGGVILGASPSGVLQWSKITTRGTNFLAFGLKNSAREKDHAYVCEYELRAFQDGSSTQELQGRRFYTHPMIPEAVRSEVNYPNLGKDGTHAGTWMVPYAIAMELRNEFEFTISLEAKLPAVRKSEFFSLNHLFKPPEHELAVRKVETRHLCIFAIARLRSFIKKSTRQTLWQNTMNRD